MTLPSGTTSSPSTADPGVERWIFSVLASRVNLTQMRGCGRSPEGFPMTETSGPIASASYLKWDQNTQFWRTSQASMWEMEDGQHMGAPWLDSFPRSGICQFGLVYPLPMQAHHTSETGGGLWPTPVARDSGGHTITPNYPEGFNSNLVTEVEKERRRHIPTPTSADVYTGNMESSQQSDDSMHSVILPDYVSRFPTPSTMDHMDRKQMRPSRAATNRKTGYLSEMIGNWPTPNSRDHKLSLIHI